MAMRIPRSRIDAMAKVESKRRLVPDDELKSKMVGDDSTSSQPAAWTMKSYVLLGTYEILTSFYKV